MNGLMQVERGVATGSTSRRFFADESIEDVKSKFEKFRAADDNANAAACFDRLAQQRFKYLSQQPDFDPSRPSIISAFLPKSGGTFLQNRMLQLGYKEFSWCFHHRCTRNSCYAGEEALKLYLSGGCTCHTHALPNPNILAAWDRSHVTKIWVHLRNPAEAVVSGYHHSCGEGQGEGAIADERRKKVVAEANLRPVRPDAGKNAFVMAYIDGFAQWVATWLHFAEQRPGRVVFSFYRELEDPQALFARVFGELGAELNGNVSAELTARDRYRQKKSNDWRTDLSLDAQEYVERQVREILGEFPAFESLWS